MVSIATWNVDNLFSPAAEDGPSPDQYAAKLDGLARAITQADVDAVALQEIGDEAALAALAERLDGDWQTAVSQKPDGRGIRVAVVSRLSLSNVVDVVAIPEQLAGGRVDDAGAVLTEMGRGALQVDLGVGERTYTLITAHLKSKLLTYPGGRFSPRNEDERARFGAYALNRRTAEAATVRIQANQVIDGQGRERRVLVLGDLNDTVEAATTQIVQGPGGSEIGTPGEKQPDAGDAWRLWNVAPLIPAEKRFSRVYRGRRELIDHIMISRLLLGEVTEATSLVEARLPSVTDTPRRATAAPFSDHAIVLCRFSD